MKVQIHLLRRTPTLSARLKKDGWRLEFESERALVAYHPEVSNAGEARERLSRLGVLTSATLRIDFPFRETRAEADAYLKPREG